MQWKFCYSINRHIWTEIVIIGLISVINFLPHDTSSPCCVKTNLSSPEPRWPARYRRVNLIKLCGNHFSCRLPSEGLTLDSDGIRKTVQLTVFISKPPSQGVQEKDPDLLSCFQPTEILIAKCESECETCGGMKMSKGKRRNYKGVTAATGLSLRPEAS